MTAESLRSFAATHARTRRLALSWHHAALGGILALASYLDFAKLAQNGYANTYYAGAVRSMLQSWHNFFFVSFDPGGLVSVDKRPLGLWVEAASAQLFGYSGVTILLPEALAGVVAVWLLYLLVARYFGRLAGLVSALALAISPVSVAVNRDNNPDALFVLLLVAAAYVGARAIESGRLRTLLAAAVLVGLAFNTKMLAAAVVVPGLAAGYAFFAPRLVRTRLWQLAVAGLVLVVVSGVWMAAVDLTPASDRPYVGSTTDNSALSLALGYNGLGRVTGQTGGTSTGGGLGGAFSGTPGFWRLLNDALGDQGAWLLALAVLGAASAVVAAILARRRRELGALVVIGGWFAAAAVVFSYSSGIIHTYYVSALAPATSALVGIGAIALWRDVRRGGWWVALPLAAIAASAWIEIVLLRRSGYLSWLQALVAVVALAALAAVAAGALLETARARSLVGAAALAAAVSAFLVAPGAWSATTLDGAVDGTFPGAGPTYFSLGTASTTGQLGRGGPGLGGGSTSSLDTALAYAKAHEPGTRFTLIVSSETEAADAVIRGESVAAMGGFTGRETVLTNAFLVRLISSGEARYFLLGSNGGFGGGPGGTSNAAVSTITSTCKAVTSVTTTSGTLYDCSGAASAIAAA